MAGKGTIGGKIVLEGEAEYRAALKNIKSEQTELRSEMKLCNTEFKSSQNSLEALRKKYEILTKQVDSQTQKIDVYKEALTASKKAEEDAAKKVADLQAAIQTAEKEMTVLEQSSDGASEALQEQVKAVEELKNKLALAEQDYDKISQKTESYQTSINYANAELHGMQSELADTEKYLREAEQSTDGCATSIDKYGKETEEAAEKTSAFGDVLKANLLSDAIITGVKALASGIKEIATASVETGESFEAAMSQVAATMGMTADEINSGSEAYTILSNAAKESGKSTMFSASEAAEALNYLALAGYDAQKSAATLPKVLDLAAAGGLDLAYASDLVTDSMAALGMETEQLDSYIDEMAVTSQKSNTSVSQLGEATLVCAGTVSLTSQSLETMNAELGVLANNGIKGAEGGTHLRNILLALSAPTDKASLAIQELGVSVVDSQGNMRDLNDIMIDLNAAMEGMSSAEKTQMINRIFNKTDIAAVNALLKGTGNEFNNLYREIQNSSGAASAMAETLNNNLKGKITILNSALEGLGISAYEIFDDEMKNSVQSATDAVGRLQNAMDNGDLGVSMRKFSQSLGELVEGAIDFGEDALPKVIDGLTWVIDNIDGIASGVIGITVATKGAAVAQELLNAAMNANPAGILTTAIIGLTTAALAYVAINKDNLITTDETTKATKELVRASKELNDSYAASSAERTASRTSMETEATTCKKLVQELTGLQSKTTLTTQEQIRQKAIIDQLNQAVPELNLAIDEQTGLLNMSTEEIERNVDALMAQARVEAAREDLTIIAKEQYEAEKLLAELEEQRAEQKKQVAAAQEEYNAKIEEANALYGEQTELYGTMGVAELAALEQSKAAQEELKSQISATQATIEGFTAEYETTLKYISGTEPIYSASAAIDNLGETASASGDNISGLSEAAQQAYSDMYESVSDSISKQIDLFHEWDVEAEVTKEVMLGNLQQQVDAMEAWADNIKTCAQNGIDEGLLQTLIDMGPAGAQYIASFAAMGEDEIAKVNELYAEALTIPEDVATSVAESYASVAENAVAGMTNGLAEAETDIEDAGKNMGETLHNATNEALEIHSPSGKYKEVGVSIIQGLIQGIVEERASALVTVESLSHLMVTTTQNILNMQTFAEIGRQIPDGLILGIEYGAGGVENAVKKMCTDAVAAAKMTLDIHSPSKKFAYLGEMSGEGYMEGLQKSMSNASEVIAAFIADTAMIQQASEVKVDLTGLDAGISNREYPIYQTINIYSQTDDMIETSRKFKQQMKELAKEW